MVFGVSSFGCWVQGSGFRVSRLPETRKPLRAEVPEDFNAQAVSNLVYGLAILKVALSPSLPILLALSISLLRCLSRPFSRSPSPPLSPALSRTLSLQTLFARPLSVSLSLPASLTRSLYLTPYLSCALCLSPFGRSFIPSTLILRTTLDAPPVQHPTNVTRVKLVPVNYDKLACCTN